MLLIKKCIGLLVFIAVGLVWSYVAQTQKMIFHVKHVVTTTNKEVSDQLFRRGLWKNVESIHIEGYGLTTDEIKDMKIKINSYLTRLKDTTNQFKGAYVGCFLPLNKTQVLKNVWKTTDVKKCLRGKWRNRALAFTLTILLSHQLPIIAISKAYAPLRRLPGISKHIGDLQYFVSLERNSFICGSEIEKQYILKNKLLPDADEEKCAKIEAYSVFIQQSLHKIGESVEEKDIKACVSFFDVPTIKITLFGNVESTCRPICQKLNFVLAGVYAKNKCVCTFPSLRNMELVSTEVKPPCCRHYKEKILLVDTSVEDLRCSKKKFLPANMIPPIGLISFPGSGNSWSRHLIELATGIYTGSIYNNKEIYRKGFLGEYLPWNSGKTIVIKSHKPNIETDDQYAKIILLVRNPFDAILAEFNRLYGGQTGFANEKKFTEKEWKLFVHYKIVKWSTTYITYTEQSVPLLIVYYENLAKSPRFEIQRMLTWINITVADLDQRLPCTLNKISGPFRRKKRPLKLKPYDKTLTALVNRHIKQVRYVMEQRRFDNLLPYERNS